MNTWSNNDSNIASNSPFLEIEVLHCAGPWVQAQGEHFHHHRRIFPSLDQVRSPWQEQQLHHTCAQVHFLPNQSLHFPKVAPWRMPRGTRWPTNMHERRRGRQSRIRIYCSKGTPIEPATSDKQHHREKQYGFWEWISNNIFYYYCYNWSWYVHFFIIHGRISIRST